MARLSVGPAAFQNLGLVGAPMASAITCRTITSMLGWRRHFIQHLIRFVATSGEVNEQTTQVLFTILATEISPELVPPKAGEAIQSTQKVIGPYELQDFNLFYVTRFNSVRRESRSVAFNAWSDAMSRRLAGQHPRVGSSQLCAE